MKLTRTSSRVTVRFISSLTEIKVDHGHILDTRPPQSEISTLLDWSGTLFIYAATAIHYTSQGGLFYCKSRLSVTAKGDKITEKFTDINH